MVFRKQIGGAGWRRQEHLNAAIADNASLSRALADGTPDQFPVLSAIAAFSDFAPSFETPEASSFVKASEDTSSDRPALFLESIAATLGPIR